MADALASGASVRKDVGVQVPPSAPRIVLKSLNFSTFSFVRRKTTATERFSVQKTGNKTKTARKGGRIDSIRGNVI